MLSVASFITIDIVFIDINFKMIKGEKVEMISKNGFAFINTQAVLDFKTSHKEISI